MKKNILIVTTLLMFTLNYFCQDIISSKTYVNTCYNKHQCFSLSNGSFIYYNTANSELIIIVDFNMFKLGNDSLDEWLGDLDDTKLIFKGALPTSNLLELTHHNSKTILVNGIITFNNISINHTIEFTLFELANNGLLFKDNMQDYFDRLNINLQFAFYPKEFKINKKAHHLKKSITIAIYRGYINELKQGMEHLIIDNINK